MTASWALVLRDLPDGTSVLLLRLRLTGLRHPRLTGVVGGWFDALTTVAMIAGLRERVGPAGRRRPAGRANRQAWSATHSPSSPRKCARNRSCSCGG